MKPWPDRTAGFLCCSWSAGWTLICDFWEFKETQFQCYVHCACYFLVSAQEHSFQRWSVFGICMESKIAKQKHT